MRRIAFAVLFLLVFTFTLAAVSVGAKVLDLSNDVYQLMDDLYLSCGLAFPSGSRPWSVHEAGIILSRVEDKALNEVSKAIYLKLQDLLELTDRDSTVELGLKFSPEVYFHTNEEDFNLDTDWVNNFTSRNPFGIISLEMGIENFLYTYCNLGYGWGRVSYKDEVKPIQEATDNWYGLGSLIKKESGSALTVTKSHVYSQSLIFNFPDIKMIEINVPRRALLSTGGSHWNLSFAHDRINWGTSMIGNMVIDSHVPYQDYLRLKGFSDKLSMDFICMFMDTDFGTDYASRFDDLSEFFLLHRFEYRILPWLSFAFSENVMYKPAVTEGKFFNLSNFLHQYNNSYVFNAIASVELELALKEGFGLYGQYCLDQAQAPTEDDSQAGAYGYLVGLRSQFLIGQGYLLARAEYAYTSPALYRRNFVDFLMIQKYSTNVLYTRPLIVDSIGFPYFGDSQVSELNLQYNHLNGLKTSAYLRLIRKGTINPYSSVTISGTNNYDDVPNIKGRSPYGDQYTDTLILGTQDSFLIKDCFSFLVQADFIFKRIVQKNQKVILKETSDTQITFGIGLIF